MHEHIRSVGASFVAGPDIDSPFEIVKQVIKEMPTASRTVIFEEFRSRLAESAECQRSVEWYFFTNMHHVITDPRPKNAHHRRAPSRQELEQVRRAADGIKAQIILLDLTMPNGKPMKDCTGADMAMFGNRFQKIADKVGKSKLVGSVLSEDQVQALMK